MSASALSGRKQSDDEIANDADDYQVRSMVAKSERMLKKVVGDLRDRPRQRNFIARILVQEAKRDVPRREVFRAAGAKVDPDVVAGAPSNPACYVVRALSDDDARKVVAAVLNRETGRDDPRDAVVDACREKLESGGAGGNGT